MRTKSLLTAGLVTIALAGSLAACSTDSSDSASSPSASTAASAPADSSAGSTASTGSTATVTGTFAGENGKKAAGTITISGSTITLSGYSSDEGPDLHLYLANGTDEKAVAAGTEIDDVSYEDASQTFTLPAGVDASSFTHAVIHCDKAKATFGAATLSS